MRKQFFVTISLLALLVTACGTSQRGKPSPTVLGTQGPALPSATDAPAPQAPAPPPPAPPAAAPTAPPMPVVHAATDAALLRRRR